MNTWPGPLRYDGALEKGCLLASKMRILGVLKYQESDFFPNCLPTRYQLSVGLVFGHINRDDPNHLPSGKLTIEIEYPHVQ